MAYSYPAAALNDRYLVTIIGTLHNQTIMSTFWYALGTMVGAPTKLQIMDELKTILVSGGNLDAKYLAVAPQNYHRAAMWVQPIDPVRYVKKVYPNAVDGTWPVDADTANVSAVITRRGVQAARNAVSTLHVPISSDATSLFQGNLTAGLKTAVNTLATQVAATVTTAAGHVLFPIIRHGVGVANFTFIGEAFRQDTVRVMRRRTVGLGI